MKTAEELESFLSLYSKTYPQVISINELARGGEAVVYRVEHWTDEIVVKCPLFESDTGDMDVFAAYDSIFYES